LFILFVRVVSRTPKYHGTNTGYWVHICNLTLIFCWNAPTFNSKHWLSEQCMPSSGIILCSSAWLTDSTTHWSLITDLLFPSPRTPKSNALKTWILNFERSLSTNLYIHIVQ
jgi:hypothetical protein